MFVYCTQHVKDWYIFNSVSRSSYLINPVVWKNVYSHGSINHFDSHVCVF